MYKDFIAAMSKFFDLSHSWELKWYLGGKVEQNRKRALCGSVRSSIAMTRSKDSRCVIARMPVDTPCEANLHLAASDSPPLDKRDANVVRNCQQLFGT